MTVIAEPDRHAAELEAILDRLSQPRTAAALESLLDHAELLAVIVGGLDGLARKGDVIADTVAEVLRELRAAGRSTGMDLKTTTHQLSVLIPTFAEAAPAISRVAHSAIVDEEAVAVVGMMGTALSAGFAAAKEKDARIGLRGLLRATKDEDVQRGLGLLVEMARALGRQFAEGGRVPDNA